MQQYPSAGHSTYTSLQLLFVPLETLQVMSRKKQLQ